jgi:hypothetical protein
VANETATITDQLVDEASAGLDQLASRFDDLRKSVDQFYQQGNERQRRHRHRASRRAGNAAAAESGKRLSVRCRS